MTTLRERKRQDTRERLIGAAVALFVEQGYDATSMDDIAARAEVSRATAFNYFARKEDFLVAWAERRREGLQALFASSRRDGEPVLTSLERSVIALTAWYVRDAAETRPMIRAWLRGGGPLLPQAGDTAEVLAGALREGQRAGEVRADVDVAAAGRLLHNGFVGALYFWAMNDVTERWLRKEVSAATRLLLAGVAV